MPYALAILSSATGKVRVLPHEPSTAAVLAWLAKPPADSYLLLLPLGQRLVIAADCISTPDSHPLFCIHPTEVLCHSVLHFRHPGVSPSIGWSMSLAQLALFLEKGRSEPCEIAALFSADLGCEVWLMRTGLPPAPAPASILVQTKVVGELELWPYTSLGRSTRRYVVLSGPLENPSCAATSSCLGFSKVDPVLRLARKQPARAKVQAAPMQHTLLPMISVDELLRSREIVAGPSSPCHQVRYPHPPTLAPEEHYLTSTGSLVEIFAATSAARRHLDLLDCLSRAELPPHFWLNTYFPQVAHMYHVGCTRLALVTRERRGPQAVPRRPGIPTIDVVYRLLHLVQCISLAPAHAQLLGQISGMQVSPSLPGNPLKEAVQHAIQHLPKQYTLTQDLSSLAHHPLFLLGAHLPHTHFCLLYLAIRNLYEMDHLFIEQKADSLPHRPMLQRHHATGHIGYACYVNLDGPRNTYALVPTSYASAVKLLQFYCFQGRFAGRQQPENWMVPFGRTEVHTSHRLPDAVVFSFVTRPEDCLAVEVQHVVDNPDILLYLLQGLLGMVQNLVALSQMWPIGFGLEDLIWDPSRMTLRLLCAEVACTPAATTATAADRPINAPSIFTILPASECELRATRSILLVIFALASPRLSAALTIGLLGQEPTTLQALHTTLSAFLTSS